MDVDVLAFDYINPTVGEENVPFAMDVPLIRWTH